MFQPFQPHTDRLGLLLETADQLEYALPFQALSFQKEYLSPLPLFLFHSGYPAAGGKSAAQKGKHFSPGQLPVQQFRPVLFLPFLHFLSFLLFPPKPFPAGSLTKLLPAFSQVPFHQEMSAGPGQPDRQGTSQQPFSHPVPALRIQETASRRRSITKRPLFLSREDAAQSAPQSERKALLVPVSIIRSPLAKRFHL